MIAAVITAEVFAWTVLIAGFVLALCVLGYVAERLAGER